MLGVAAGYRIISHFVMVRTRAPASRQRYSLPKRPRRPICASVSRREIPASAMVRTRRCSRSGERLPAGMQPACSKLQNNSCSGPTFTASTTITIMLQPPTGYLMADQFEALIEGLLEDRFGTSSNFLEPDLITGLRQRLLANHAAGSMHPAGIGQKFDFKRNLSIRGDVIQWLEENSTDPYEQAFQERIQAFILYLNRTCYTGINTWEFHYAYYETGSFYQRHLDQFKHDRRRKFSFIVYLNDQWTTEDGGQLRLFTPNGEVHLDPQGGRAVLFKSDELEHEVLPARLRPRLSIAGWLKV